MGRRVYTEAEKDEALALLADHSKSFYEVRDSTGVPVGTLHRWSVEAGMERTDDETKAATATRLLRLQAKRSYLVELLVDTAIEHTERARLEPKPSGVQALQTASAIALDKFRLEMGEHTDYQRRSTDTEPAEKVQGRLDELAERRQIKSA